MAQFVVVDQILVAKGQAKHPLPDQARHPLLDQIRRAMVGETAAKPLNQPDRPVGGAKHHVTGVRSHWRAKVRQDRRVHLIEPLPSCQMQRSHHAG